MTGTGKQTNDLTGRHVELVAHFVQCVDVLMVRVERAGKILDRLTNLGNKRRRRRAEKLSNCCAGLRYNPIKNTIRNRDWPGGIPLITFRLAHRTIYLLVGERLISR